MKWIDCKVTAVGVELSHQRTRRLTTASCARFSSTAILLHRCGKLRQAGTGEDKQGKEHKGREGRRGKGKKDKTRKATGMCDREDKLRELETACEREDSIRYAACNRNLCKIDVSYCGPCAEISRRNALLFRRLPTMHPLARLMAAISHAVLSHTISASHRWPLFTPSSSPIRLYILRSGYHSHSQTQRPEGKEWRVGGRTGWPLSCVQRLRSAKGAHEPAKRFHRSCS